jgi:hypothetical protein
VCASAIVRYNTEHTPACTGERSIDQRYSQLGTRWNTHSYLRLTCIGCWCGRRIGGCSGYGGGRSSVRVVCSAQGDGRALWFHAVALPCGCAHMPSMPLRRNES